ncbi:MAG: hypothetical protein RIM99_19625 [Cyclobacteriaceae bacterium]
MKNILITGLIVISILSSIDVFAQTTQQLSLTNGDGWYRIISSVSSSGGGVVKIYGTSGNNRQTLITMNVSLMRFGQGGSIDITDNLFYNTNHVDQIRGGSVNNQEFVLDVHFVGINNPSNLWVKVDGNNLSLLNNPTFNPTPPDGNVIEISGRVIGTNSKRWPIYFGQNVGIGTAAPDEKLHIKNGGTLLEMDSQYGNDPRILFQNDGTGANPYQTFYRWTGGASNYYATRIYEGGNQGFKIQNGSSTTYGNHTFTDSFVLLKNGNIGIGISSPTQKLQVAGTVYSTEVKVEVAAGQGPDYVFEPNYELRTLQETKEYITENKHLPEIPSAKEMEANGVELGDMNMRLLKKIEELTLYLIEQNGEIQELKKEVNILKNK